MATTATSQQHHNHQHELPQRSSSARQPPPLRRRSLLGSLLPRRTVSDLQQHEGKLRRMSLVSSLPRRRMSLSMRTSTTTTTIGTGKDDELSVSTSSSTGSIIAHNNNNNKTTTIQKKVRFASRQQNEYYDNTQMCFEDCRDELWFTRDEYKKLNESLQCLSSGLEKAEKFSCNDPSSYTNILLYTYVLCTNAANGDTSTSHNTNNSTTTSVLSGDEFQELTQRLKVSSSRLGLERRVIPQFRQERFAQRRKMLQQIQRIQSSNCSKSNKTKSKLFKPEQIRHACENISRPSRLFFLQLAQAHAASLQSTTA